MSTTHLSNTLYASLPLADDLKQRIADVGYEYCTPIQAKTLPYTLEGKDVAGQAQTGTGKSAAFLVATIHYLLTHPADEKRRANQPRALILAPTRELAMQIHQDAKALTDSLPITMGLAFGGANYARQKEEIEAGVDILVGTPGRLIDYLKQKVFDLKQCQVVVLDEADRMFDLGFISDMRYLLRRCPDPSQRLSMLFSATLSQRVQELAYEHMNNPTLVEVEVETVTSEKIDQRVYQPAMEEKIPLLLGLYKQLGPKRSIVFVNTKRNADDVWRYFDGNGINAAVLSGDVPQRKRSSMMQKFQNGEIHVLVATDVASRGLHIDGVTHVFNYDLPQSGEDYVHRIGRTARAGAEGIAISFACEDTAFNLMDIEMYIEASLPKAKITEDILATPAPPTKREPRQSREGSRNGKKPTRRAGSRTRSSRQRSGRNQPNHKNGNDKHNRH